jgi:hypothetical protein
VTRITTSGRSKRYAITDADTLVASGELQDGDYLATPLTVVADEDDNAFLAAVPVDALDPLPAAGTELESGDLYADAGRAVMVRQPHTRTEHPVDDLVPTLFLVYRENVDGIEWVAGESVTRGTIRTYDGTEYRCIQPHVTEFAPPSVPALWEPFVVGDEWVDSGESVTSLIGSGVIGVTDTAPFSAGQRIRIAGEHEASITRIHQAGAPGILVIDPHIAVSGGETIEVLA